MQDEQELIRSALGGDTDAYEVLVIRHRDRLYSSMINIVGSHEEAEDVVQETFVQAYVKLDTFQMNAKFFTWIYRIGFNFALGRRRKRRSHLSLEVSRESGNEPQDAYIGPDENLLQQERVREVQIALNKLSDDHRDILVLREMEGMAYEDIAETLSISPGTVRSRLSRARGALKAVLEMTSGNAIEDSQTQVE